MKDSGVEWIGEIPEHWQTTRLKSLFSFGKGLPITKENLKESGSEVISYGQIHAKNNTGTSIDQSLIRFVSSTFLETNKASLVHKGDFIFADTSEDLDGCGNCVYNDSRDTIFAGYHTIILKALANPDNKYLAYLFLTDCWRSQIRRKASGVKLFSISKKILNEVSVLLPPLQEQQAIADYLDKKCTSIDSIVAKTKQTIADYKSYKASLIYEAVTKGLDPNVEMKDSGVEWIGEIPESWSLLRCKNLIYEINKRTETGEEVPLSMSQVLGIVPSNMISVANPSTSYLGHKIVQKNDLVFNKLKAHLGVFAVSRYTGLVSPDYAVYRGYNICCVKFLEYLFKTQRCITEFKKYITGVGASLSRLYSSNLFNIKVAIPSLQEQQAIADYLDKKCTSIDTLIAKKEALIADLEAYKKSLIYECVTGKRQVR